MTVHCDCDGRTTAFQTFVFLRCHFRQLNTRAVTSLSSVDRLQYLHYLSLTVSNALRCVVCLRWVLSSVWWGTLKQLQILSRMPCCADLLFTSPISESSIIISTNCIYTYVLMFSVLAYSTHALRYLRFHTYVFHP